MRKKTSQFNTACKDDTWLNHTTKTANINKVRLVAHRNRDVMVWFLPARQALLLDLGSQEPCPEAGALLLASESAPISIDTLTVKRL